MLSLGQERCVTCFLLVSGNELSDACQDYLTPFPTSTQLQNIVVLTNLFPLSHPWCVILPERVANLHFCLCPRCKGFICVDRVRVCNKSWICVCVCVCLYSRCIIGAYFLLAPPVALTLLVCDWLRWGICSTRQLECPVCLDLHAVFWLARLALVCMCVSVTQCGSLLFDVSHCVRAKLLPATAERKTVRDPYLDFS